MSETNEIIIDPARCIYVKYGNNSEIYFSNYYLNTLFKDEYVNANPIIIKFSKKNFMNDDIIPPEDKASIESVKSRIQEKLATTINRETLNVLDYSKITYSSGPAGADAAVEKAVLDPAISEKDILDTLKEPITINSEQKIIFKNIEQLRQYLKYDGFWYRTPPIKYYFKDREETTETKPLKPVVADSEEAGGKVEQVDGQGGGKKTTTRRRRKAVHNKHRKSNRRR
jgi:hypothetical protein